MSTIINANGSIQNTQWDIVKFPQNEGALSETRPEQSPVQNSNNKDSVHMRSSTAPVNEATLIADEDVDAVLEQTMQLIVNNPHMALRVHEGLSASRVAALLA